MFVTYYHRFIVRDLEMEEGYLFDMKVQICREADTQTTPCAVENEIFDKFILPKQTCDWNSDFATPGFSFTNWLTSNGVTRTEPLLSTVTSKLNSDTGIAAYLHAPPCNRDGSAYIPSMNGIKNGE